MTGKARAVCWRLSLLTLLLMLSACNIGIDALPGALAEGSAAAAPSTGWAIIALGLEWREITHDKDQPTQLKILRIDPQRFSFRAIYSPAQPYSLAQWRAREPEALTIVNANFFDPSYRALGLVIVDGEAHGSPYLERGGSFLVTKGMAAVRANESLPHRELESAQQAVQGFPLLVEKGRRAYFGPARQRRARRTAIAEDADGNILVISARLPGLTLGDLSAFLAESDLEIVSAFNLDGGGSTLMAVRDINYFQPSFDAVPAILAVYRR